MPANVRAGISLNPHFTSTQEVDHKKVTSKACRVAVVCAEFRFNVEVIGLSGDCSMGRYDGQCETTYDGKHLDLPEG